MMKGLELEYIVHICKNKRWYKILFSSSEAKRPTRKSGRKEYNIRMDFIGSGYEVAVWIYVV